MDQFLIFILLFSGLCTVGSRVPRRYHFVNKHKTWAAAQSHCRQHYTDLATINNMEDINHLTNTDHYGYDVAWIGLYDDINDSESWRWSLDNSDLYSQQFHNWEDGQANNWRGTRECVVLYKGKWDDYRCTYRFYFLCYDGSQGAVTNQTYVLIKQNKIWRDAQSYCIQHYTDLASVKNENENNQIMDKVPAWYKVWIGLHIDSWKWADGTNSSLRHWMNQQHDNAGRNENCAVTRLDHSGKWEGRRCEDMHPFFCYEDKLVLIRKSFTWNEALRFCREKHEDLVSVYTEEIQRWVEEVAKNASSTHVWLGLRYSYTLGFWMWVSGKSGCYEHWAPGHGPVPGECGKTSDSSAGQPQQTGAVPRRGSAGQPQHWVSLLETEKHNFICITYQED